MKTVAVTLFILAMGMWVLSIWTHRKAELKALDVAVTGSRYEVIQVARLESAVSTMRIAAGASLLLSLVLLLVVFDREKKERASKKCPQCAELVKKEAAKCRFCGSELIPDFS